jgi:hypothetical protein
VPRPNPNPTAKEIEQWLVELPTIEDLKSVPGFEVSKTYFLVRMGRRWQIGVHNPYVDAKNITDKPTKVLCFADGADKGKPLLGKRDAESPSLNTIKLEAQKSEKEGFAKFLVNMGLGVENICFVWEKSPQEKYLEQIEEYKKLHSVSKLGRIVFGIFLTALLLGVGEVCYRDKTAKPSENLSQAKLSCTEIIDRLNSEYQKLPLNRKMFFLRKTGLAKASDTKTMFAKKPLGDFINRYFSRNQSKFDNLSKKSLFLENLLKEI